MPDDSENKVDVEARRALRKSKLKVKKIAVHPGDPRDDVQAYVKDIIVQQKGIDPETLTADSRFQEDLGYDDLDFVEFIYALEETFGIEIPDEVADRIRTVRDAIVTVLDLLGGDR